MADRVTCSTCGAEHLGFWYEPPAHPGVRVWAVPKTAPCSVCRGDGTAVAEVQAESLVRKRMSDAGIPMPLQVHRLEADAVRGQPRGEVDDVFMARCKQAHLTGILACNREALATLWSWAPPRWVAITGPPGTGKSSWLAGLARRLLAERELETLTDEPAISALAEQWDLARPLPLPGQRTIRRKTVHPLRYIRVDELMDRQRLRWKGDPEPLLKFAHVHLLFLDELGLDDPVDPAEVKMIERLLGYRHDHGLCTVVATNRRWDELTHPVRPLYGARVRDRLRTGIHVALGGPSWRP